MAYRSRRASRGSGRVRGGNRRSTGRTYARGAKRGGYRASGGRGQTVRLVIQHDTSGSSVGMPAVPGTVGVSTTGEVPRRGPRL